MNPLIVACIAAETQYDFLVNIEDAIERHAPGLELRFDSLNDLTEDFVESIIEKYKGDSDNLTRLKLISTFRHISEAGPNKELFGFKGVKAKTKDDIEKERKDYHQLAINAGTDYFDIESAHYFPT